MIENLNYKEVEKISKIAVEIADIETDGKVESLSQKTKFDNENLIAIALAGENL